MGDRLRAGIPATQANSASYPLWDGKWVPVKVRWCLAAGSKGRMVHSIHRLTCVWQIKLCDPSLTRAILSVLEISFIIKRSEIYAFTFTFLHVGRAFSSPSGKMAASYFRVLHFQSIHGMLSDVTDTLASLDLIDIIDIWRPKLEMRSTAVGHVVLYSRTTCEGPWWTALCWRVPKIVRYRTAQRTHNECKPMFQPWQQILVSSRQSKLHVLIHVHDKLYGRIPVAAANIKRSKTHVKNRNSVIITVGERGRFLFINTSRVATKIVVNLYSGFDPVDHVTTHGEFWHVDTHLCRWQRVSTPVFFCAHRQRRSVRVA